LGVDALSAFSFVAAAINSSIVVGTVVMPYFSNRSLR